MVREDDEEDEEDDDDNGIAEEENEGVFRWVVSAAPLWFLRC
jgi:hypothetical protein